MGWLVTDETRVLASAEIAESRSQRRTGLLGRDQLDGALVLRPCRWIHTIKMRFAIDVAYLDADSTVIKIDRIVPNRLPLPVRRSVAVIEAQAGAFARWGLKIGDVVEIRDDNS
ncbi:MAG: hypothetical protein CSA55_01990 [Ilumatobacter coccineus]|uniref:DUF192 domain-containing protein n=1 Tax=Ilumatobacter coccineus TaxID=467094 RepID=A0A2G6KF47_9ACTN|nr:MAG: hypothetical protein CSA55_01990 [Ilumatobacter coccineus]